MNLCTSAQVIVSMITLISATTYQHCVFSCFFSRMFEVRCAEWRVCFTPGSVSTFTCWRESISVCSPLISHTSCDQPIAVLRSFIALTHCDVETWISRQSSLLCLKTPQWCNVCTHLCISASVGIHRHLHTHTQTHTHTKTLAASIVHHSDQRSWVMCVDSVFS